MSYYDVNYVDINGRSQSTLSVSGTAAQTGVLTPGVYDVWCDESDVYIKVAGTANDVTTSNGYVIKTGNVVAVKIGAPTDMKLGAITGGTSGTLRYHRVG